MTLRRPLTIRAVTTSEEFKGLAREWDALLSTIPGHSLFLTWEWLYYWAMHYVGDGQLRILLAFDKHGKLVGIAPLYLRRFNDHAVIAIRELRLLGSEAVCSSYLDLIVPEQDKPAMVQTAAGPVEVRKLSPEEKARRRLRMNIIMFVICMVILIVAGYVFTML